MSDNQSRELQNPNLVNPESQSPQNTSTRWLWAFIVTIIAIGTALGIWWWQGRDMQVALPNPTLVVTANWKLYRNDQYGFEFRYPGDWKYESIEKRSDGYYMDRIYSSQFALNILSKSYEGITSYKTFEGILSDGRVAKGSFYYWCENLGCETEDRNKPRIILVQLDHAILAEKLDLELSFRRQNEEEASNIFQQILSTFKFSR